MNYYVTCFKKYVDFNGRSARKEFWIFYLINTVVIVVLEALMGASLVSSLTGGSNTVSPASSVLYGVVMLYSLAILLPSLAVGARRMHDIGKSGWWILINFVPLIGWIWFIILAATDSNSGQNKYGANVKGAK